MTYKCSKEAYVWGYNLYKSQSLVHSCIYTFFFQINKKFDYRWIDLNLCIYSLEHQKQFWCSDILQFNSSHVSWIIFVTKQIYVLIGTCVDFIRSYRCSWIKDIHQFGWRISKMVGPKKQDFWPKINILKGFFLIGWWITLR